MASVMVISFIPRRSAKFPPLCSVKLPLVPTRSGSLSPQKKTATVHGSLFLKLFFILSLKIIGVLRFYHISDFFCPDADAVFHVEDVTSRCDAVE